MLNRWMLKSEREEKKQMEVLRKEYNRMRAFAVYLATPGGITRQGNGRSHVIVPNKRMRELASRDVEFKKTFPADCTMMTVRI